MNFLIILEKNKIKVFSILLISLFCVLFANEYTQKKLDNFFIKPRFKNNSFDLDLKLIIKRFINEFVAFKMFYLLMSNLI